MTFELLSTDIEMCDRQSGTQKVYFNSQGAKYIVTNEDGSQPQCFAATVNPENLSKEQRHRVLNYCLSSFDDDEIVNHLDLFLQGEFIRPSSLPADYSLEDKYFWE